MFTAAPICQFSPLAVLPHPLVRHPTLLLLPSLQSIPGFSSMLTVSSPDWSPAPICATFPVSFPSQSPSRLYVASIPVATSAPSWPPSPSSTPSSSPHWASPGSQAGFSATTAAPVSPPELPFPLSSSCGGRISTHIAGCDGLTHSDGSSSGSSGESGRILGAAACAVKSKARCCPDSCCNGRMTEQAACRPAGNLPPRTRLRVPFRGQIQVVSDRA